MATISKEPSGTYRVRIRKNGVTKSAAFRTKAQANAWAASVETEIEAGRLGKTPDKTFGQLIERYLAEEVPKKRGSRWEELRFNALLGRGKSEVADPLVKVWLDDLSPDHFAQWRDRRLSVVSAGSVLREWNALSAACTVAVKEWRWLPSNPMSQVRRPKSPAPRTRRISQDEIDRICLATGYHDGLLDTATARVGAAFLFAIETAMRAGEICGLREEDVSGRVAHLPKTKNGYARNVPLSSRALEILKQLPEGESTLFNVPSASLDALFRKAKDRAMIEDLHFHDTRREALSRLAKKVDVLTLAKISGHRDLRILSNVYYQTDMGEVADMIG